ncbi:MAG: hypothetical protein KatS3mg123_1655 [Burkholderiales bacterium]|nr:MAG: hypothetical protein KatS3mg123_1655 [Burkholderiales bacterium]
MARRTVNCEEVLRHLFAYIDQELDAEASAEIERHLELCRGCFSRVEVRTQAQGAGPGDGLD